MKLERFGGVGRYVDDDTGVVQFRQQVCNARQNLKKRALS
jgi:hypothetical protein